MKIFIVTMCNSCVRKINADYSIVSDDMVALCVRPEPEVKNNVTLYPSDYAVATFYKPISVIDTSAVAAL